MNDTTTKVQAQIIKHLETSNTLREAVKAAAWEATQEAKSLGWSERTIVGLWQTFANVAADMVTEAAA